MSVSWVRGELVYAAWCPCGSDNPYAKRGYSAIGYFTTGTDEEKMEAAKAACIGRYMRGSHGNKNKKGKAATEG